MYTHYLFSQECSNGKVENRHQNKGQVDPQIIANDPHKNIPLMRVYGVNKYYTAPASRVVWRVAQFVSQHCPQCEQERHAVAEKVGKHEK